MGDYTDFTYGSGTSGLGHFFVDYNDTSTTSTPLTLVDDTWTTIPNDGLGSATQENLPQGFTTLLGSGGDIDPTGLPLKSAIFIRPDFTVTPTSNNSSLRFRYSLGTGGGTYTLERTLGRLDEGAGIEYRQSLETHYIYMGDANTNDNPITLQVKLTGGGTLVNAGMAIEVLA